DDGQLASEEVLAGLGYLPIVYNEPAHDPALQRVILLPRTEWPIETKRVVAAYAVTDISIEELREAKLEEATAMRWQVMTGGLTLPGGIQVGTDIDDQNRITSVLSNYEHAGLNDESIISFKAKSGFVKITIAQLKEIAGAIGQHVQACYDAEEMHFNAIEALATREEIAAYDTGQGWPENEITEPATEPVF